MIAEMMDRFIEGGTQWLYLIGLATWRTLPLLLCVFALTLLLRRKLSPAIQAFLWTIVIVRLLLPVSVASPLSLHNAVDAWFGSPASIDQDVLSVQSDPPAALLPNVAETESIEWDVQRADNQSTSIRRISMEEMIVSSFLLGVVSVTLVLLGRGCLSYLRFAIGLRSCRIRNDQSLIDMLLRECDALAVGRRPAIREVPGLTAPAVYGLVRHTICMPTGMIESLSDSELRWVLRHELAHIRRRDTAVTVLASIANACHWFNPLVWFCNSRLRTAMESSADQLAVAGLSSMETNAYGHLLLRLAESNASTRPAPVLGLLPFAGGRYLKQRVCALTRNNTSPRSWLVRTGATLLVASLAISGLSDAREAKKPAKPVIHLPVTGAISAEVHRPNFEPWNFKGDDEDAYAKSYDIDGVLKNLPRVLTEEGWDAKTTLLRWLPLPIEIAQYIEVQDRSLTAKLTARQHELLKHTLAAWQNGEPRQITIETRFIQSTTKIASSIDWVGKRIESLKVDGLGPAIAARLDESELKALISSAQDERRTNIMFAPRVTCFDGQDVHIADVVGCPFVTGIEAGLTSARPVISVVDEGLKLMLIPRTQSDKIALSFQIQGTNIRKVSYANLPIRMPHESEPRFTVQVPATERYALSAAVELQSNESIAIAIPRVFNLEPGADADTTVLVTLTPRLIDKTAQP